MAPRGSYGKLPKIAIYMVKARLHDYQSEMSCTTSILGPTRKRPRKGGLFLVQKKPGLRRDSRTRLRLVRSSSSRCRFVQNPVMDREERQLQSVRYSDFVVDVA